MIKKLYLKHFIFFLLLLSCSFNSYSLDDEEQEARMYRRLMRGALYDNDGYGYNNQIKPKMPFLDVVNFSIKQGSARALSEAALNVISRLLQIIPFSVNKLISMIKAYSYKMSFGTTGLSVKDLTKFSNRINSFCSPLASSQLGNMRKTKRANTIENEQSNGEFVDQVWLKRQMILISELEHVISFLKRELPCYNSAFQSIDASFFEKQMASILYAISTENNDEIQNYIIRLIGYIKDLISLINSFNSFDNAIEHAEETKTLLNFIRLTFEHISSFLSDSAVKGVGAFQKLTEDTSSNKRDLMDILGNGALK